MNSAETYAMARQFQAALKLYDRVLDITPNDLDVMRAKAGIYQGEGNLQEAAKLLTEVNAQTPSDRAFGTKITQLQLERSYDQAIQLLQVRLTQFHYDSEQLKGYDQVRLAFFQHFAGDTAGAQGTAEQARKTLEQFYRDHPDNGTPASVLSEAYALIGEKDSALKLAEHAITLLPRAKDAVSGPGLEENLAAAQTLVGENSRAISSLAQLLQTFYWSRYFPSPITPALLRLDPLWDPLRSDPAFQNLCEEKIDKSIAVLPLENLSDDPNNPYFADGIQEEILTRLAKIADLKVISRTSTSRYKSKPDDIGEIARQLGVANILEGSVQKANDQLRVNVQLINAETDSHVWADTYDRKLTDIFGVESEIAKGIATALQAKLTGHEEQTLAAKPTNNPEAYDAYLRGLAFETRSMASLGDLSRPDLERKAISFYERAVELDPNFAIAWSRLCIAAAHLYRIRGVPVQSSSAGATARGAAAKRALENAQKLDPNSPETLLALGYYQYRMLIDYGAAKVTFARVSKILPSSSEALLALGRVARREGHWDESVAYYEQALTLDPRDVELLMDAAVTYACLRQFPTALKLHDRVLDIAPNDLDVMAAEASIYQAQGNLQKAARFLSEINEKSPSSNARELKIVQLRLERNYAEAIRMLQTRLAQFHLDSGEDKAGWKLHLALMQRLAGDTAGAKATAEQARNTFEQLYRDQPENDEFAVALSQAYAALGEKDSALKAAEQAIVLLPSAKDRMWAPSRLENMALIQTICGEKSRAIETLAQLLQTPYDTVLYVGPAPVTPSLLRLDPIWDPLRADPDFQKLCEGKQP
jgi:TolB-like protein/Flp pilus assembly protein TadD